MKGFQKLAKRAVRRTLLMMLFLLISSIVTYIGAVIYLAKTDTFKSPPADILRTISKGLHTRNDTLYLDTTATRMLDEKKVWAMLIDNNSGDVKWSYSLPDSIPLHYNISDVALFSRSYLEDFPTFIWTHDEGLIVIGMSEKGYARISAYVPMSMLQKLPWLSLFSYIIQLFTILLIFYYSERRLFRSLKPILKGLQDVTEGKDVHIEEKGTLSEVATYLNQTSALLKKRATVRENWLAGVSHDIRTPLASILGYSGQIEANKSLPEDVSQKAAIIRNQAIRLRELVSDLNLSSRLEHEDRLPQSESFLIAPFCREIIAEFLNNYGDEHYPLDIQISRDIQNIRVNGSPQLLKRGIYNLLLNSIRHNPNGCNITFRLETTNRLCMITISDDGVGVPETLLANLRKIQSKEADSTLLSGQEHGLGLYIVCQIVKMHSGNISFSTNMPTGLQTTIYLPIS